MFQQHLFFFCQYSHVQIQGRYVDRRHESVLHTPVTQGATGIMHCKVIVSYWSTVTIRMPIVESM